MTPTPQEPVITEPIPASQTLHGDAVVISGMSGCFPDTINTKGLDDILYSKKNPITADNPRWQNNQSELPTQLGKIPELNTFDAQFFRVHFRLGNNMDPMARKLLEHSYQAIYDAGLSPTHLSGKKVGVYIGSCLSETEKACFEVASSRNGFGIMGCNKSMFANRISYWLNAKGPSMAIDAACSSGMVALERAYEAISRGDCEAAIVGGANICLHPQSSVHYGRIMKLAMDGVTKTFDKDAHGCARSEAINILFLQKASDARRIYANVCHVKSIFEPKLDDNLKQVYGSYRDEHKLTQFLRGVYDETGIPPAAVEYVEAFGSSVLEADKSELEAISKVFCKDRADPLLIGSVISNVGYGEAASGITAICKVLLGYQRGEIAANLHCDSPRDDVEALREGRMKVVTDHQPFRRTYTAVNSLSVTGINVHVVLHGNYKPRDLSRYHSNIPYLVPVSGRQESAVQSIFDDLKARPVDPEEVALLHNIHEMSTQGHLGRGFIILGKNDEGQTVSLTEKVDYCDDAKRQLWFVYSGMGSQWAGMGAQLMRIPVFAAAIERCRVALEPKGVDIVNIITSPDKTMFDNILHSFVGIAAIQIGLTDVLRELGIVPDMIIGHSVGELGCAYADGCFTAEEMILSAYSRGLVSVQTPFIKGSMAAIGLGYQQMKNMVPPEIVIACHNGPDSCTISGPADVMKEFVAELTAKGIFAKEVPCSNIAYHSRYIKEAGPGLLQLLSEVIKDPKPRSERWLSTSVPQDKWDEESAKYSSAEYHTNNLLSPVLFEETSRLVPLNAVLVEIAPHGLLQAILKRSMPASCINVPLTRRGHADNAVFLLEAIGRLYIQGYNPEIRALYPRVEFPVSTGTPMLSHFVQWVHNEKWPLPYYVSARRKVAAASRLVISTHDDEHQYLKGHVLRDEVVYPYSGALVFVWDTLAMSMGVPKKELSVQFSNLQFYNPLLLSKDRVLRLSVQLQKGNGFFEVKNEDAKLIDGFVVAETPELSEFNVAEVTDVDDVNLTSRDVYKTFFDRGFDYRGEFRSILSANVSATQAQLASTDNWVTFIDSIFQLNALRRDKAARPKHVQKLLINLDEHKLMKEKMAEGNLNFIEASVNLELNSTRCGGVVMVEPQFEDLPQIVCKKPVNMKVAEFVPYFQLRNVEVTDALSIFLQIVAENVNKNTINVLEILSFENNTSLQYEVNSLLNYIPGVKINFEQINVDSISMEHVQSIQKADLVLTKYLGTSNNICELLYHVARQDIFVLVTEMANHGTVPTTLSRPVASTSTSRGRLVLARWRPVSAPAGSAAISVSDETDLPMLKSTKETLRPDQCLIVLAKYPPPYGLKEIVMKWKKEQPSQKIYVAMINPKKARDVILDQLPDFDLTFNIYNEGVWGGEYFVRSNEMAFGRRVIALRSQEIGIIDSLKWMEVSEPGPDDVAVEVHYAGLNVKDAKIANGVAPSNEDEEVELGYGMDYSGVTANGERVMGLVRGSAASVVRAQPALLWPVPAHWTLEDAATVPLSYAHAFYCLAIKASLRPGMTILVNGATGGLGQALLHIALSFGCTAFATVGDMRKKKFLRRLFPELPEERIGNSRDETFGAMVMTQTKGVGCYCVINCLKGELRSIAVQCCAISGIVLDVQQLTSKESFMYGMSNLTYDRAYYKLDFSSIFTTNNVVEMKMIQEMISEGIAKGVVRPLSRVTYDWSEAPRALKLLSASRHMGRVLLQMKGTAPSHLPRLVPSATGSHLVVAAAEDSTLAARLLDTLAARGAKNVILHSEDYQTDGYLQVRARFWQKLGVKVKFSSEDLTSIHKVEKLVMESERSAPIEGVYVVNTGEVDPRKELDLIPAISHLDAVTRKLCPNVKYFAVINESGEIGRDICTSRFGDNLPGTLVLLPNLDKFTKSPSDFSTKDDTLTYQVALQGIERAMRSPQPVVLVNTAPAPPETIIEHVAAVAGVTITEDTLDDMTLADLGLAEDNVDAVKAYLGQSVELHVTKEEVPLITVQRLREIVCEISNAKKETKGLNLLFSYVDPDEISASTDSLLMETLTACNTNMRGDEFNIEDTYLILVPGLEGNHNKFRSFCERLKVSALVLQPGFENLNESVTDMAERHAKTIQKKLKLSEKSKFYLLGYSFGAIVALELAKILENKGLEGTVFCVDAEPDTFSTRLSSWLGTSGSDLQDALILHMYALITGSPSETLASKLKSVSSWQEKVKLCDRELRGKVVHSSQYSKVLIEAAFARIQQALNYDPSHLRQEPLKARVVYIHSKQDVPSTLGQYTQQPVKSYEIDADHAKILDELNLTSIVNRNLDQNLLEDFDQRNLCETYLLNASTYMAVVEEM